ncbi:MAG: HAMP domain-containing sensor histidine kinase [Bacteroidales bacterium]
MHNIYETRENLRILFIIIALCLVGSFLYISNSLMKSLEAEERSKMEIWAEATRQLASDDTETDMGLVLKVIQSNTTIPVVIMDEEGSFLWNINFDIDGKDTISFLSKKVEELKQKNNKIEVVITEEMKQYLYYDDSVLLKQLSYYPYIQLIILLLFILISYFAFASTKKAEQNQVWVGLSKETAHQLGTPISSLMAWIEYLRYSEPTPDVLDDMNKDIVRLNTIADRFSKIGSQPKLEILDINQSLTEATTYLKKRISSKVDVKVDLPTERLQIMASQPLFEWVIENLCKNSVDATNGHGKIEFSLFQEDNKVIIEICDNGKGIPKNKFKTIFHPGYTTKKRGWGLGLTLVKRIVEEYHHGRIFVKESVPHKSTVFRIEFPNQILKS